MRQQKSVKVKAALLTGLIGVTLGAGYTAHQCWLVGSAPKDAAHLQAANETTETAPDMNEVVPATSSADDLAQGSTELQGSTLQNPNQSETQANQAAMNGADAIGDVDLMSANDTSAAKTEPKNAAAKTIVKAKKSKLEELENLLDKGEAEKADGAADDLAQNDDQKNGQKNGKPGESMILGDIDNFGDPDLAAQLKELQISYKQYLKIMRKQARLRENLKRADDNGSTHLRRLPIDDHVAWVREQLGSVTYERYAEWTGRSAE